MKLAAVYNVWDGIEILKHSVKNIKPLVDEVIIVWSKMSNRYEFSEEFIEDDFKDCTLVQSEPKYRNNPSESEREKRNVGLDKAKDLGFTHFLMMDCDEFYDPKDFEKAKKYLMSKNLNGLVCPSRVYFGSPELTIGIDSTRVPFIQKITPRLRFRLNKGYPFAYDGNGPRIDPTRQLSYNNKVEWYEDLVMEHFSWVRKDLYKKARNSSARLNNSRWENDIKNAKEGYFCEMYQRTLVKCENKFNIIL